MATERIRSGPNTRRIYGVYAQGKALLLGVCRPASETMTESATSQESQSKLALTTPDRTRRVFCKQSFCALLLFCGVNASLLPVTAQAQTLDKPSVTIDEDITAFAFARDGRIVYAVRRMFKNKKYDMQRDDIWIRDTGGRTRRIFQGEHFTVMKPFMAPSGEEAEEEVDEKGKKRKKTREEKERPLTPPFTYQVEGFSFSPNGRFVLVQLMTSTITDESGHPTDERMTLVLDETGREIKLSGDNAVIHDAKDAAWL